MYSVTIGSPVTINAHESVSCIKGTAAFFICPHGEILFVGGNHIGLVIKHPARFGLDLHVIEERYKMHNERLYTEGKARAEILLELVRNGWIRLRRYPNQYWDVTVKTWSPDTMRRLRNWSERMVTGIGDMREADHFIPIRITPITNGETVQWVTFKQLKA